MTQSTHPVDERLPAGKLGVLGLQHVLVMYAGAIAVPLIVGRALKLSPEQVAMLISADLFCCGLVTLDPIFGCHPVVWDPSTRDDGGDFCLCRAHGGDGKCHTRSDGRTNDFWRNYWCRYFVDFAGSSR